MRPIPLALALMLAAATTSAHGPRRTAPPQPEAAGWQEVGLVDATLVDRHGTKHKFRRDVVGSRIVVANFVFTSCSTVCPVQSAILSAVQDRLGDRLGSEVVLVSVSVDPFNDSPAQMNAMAERFGARPGWYWLTGDETEVGRVLGGLRARADTPGDHVSAFLVGRAGQTRWARLEGSASPEAIVAAVESLREASR